MRKIKFRVYYDNEMHYPDQFEYLQDNRNLGFYILDRYCTTDIVMQSTGLNDKNGKEIYEKMILNNRYLVCFYKDIIYLCDISKNDINSIKYYLNENESEITGEYYALSENEKRDIDKLIQQAETKIKEVWYGFTIIQPKTIA